MKNLFSPNLNNNNVIARSPVCPDCHFNCEDNCGDNCSGTCGGECRNTCNTTCHRTCRSEALFHI